MASNLLIAWKVGGKIMFCMGYEKNTRHGEDLQSKKNGEEMRDGGGRAKINSIIWRLGKEA